MNKLDYSIVLELDKFLISFQKHDSKLRINESQIDELLEHTKINIGTDIDRVAASIFIRRFGLFITANLFMLSKYRLAFNGNINNIFIVDNFTNEHWVPKFVLDDDDWFDVKEEDINSRMNLILKDFGSNIINSFSDKSNAPKLVLWENIWGYTLWMYSNLLNDASIKERIESDIYILLNNKVWEGIEKQSPFKKFIGEKSITDSIKQHTRVTCCFNNEVKGQKECPYCPRLSSLKSKN